MNWRYFGGFFLSILAGLAVFLVANRISTPYVFKGSIIDPPIEAPDFELVTYDGETYRLNDQKGKLVLIFFGYTNCPDVCPTTLAEYKQIRMLLGDRADNVEFLFITIDPERDTQERLKAYISSFDDSVLGLTGDIDVLEGVWKSYFVYRQKQDVGSAAGYLMDHSTRTYIIDRDGLLRATYLFGTEPGSIFQDVEYLLRVDR